MKFLQIQSQWHIIETNMASGDDMIERGSTGRHDAEARKDLEILDFENHIGLYGRLFIASQAQKAQEVADIINPDTQVEFQVDKDRVSLDKRDYNPVFKNLSFKERKDVWKEPYSEAKSKWLSQFTNCMRTIEKGSNRELALKTIILPGKDAATFNEGDADDLFNKFCDGKSDVHKFTSEVVSNLPSDKRDSYDLTGLVPDLQWIASGLFGRQTAGMVANLVHLESLVYNNQADILEILNRNHIKEKIRRPQDNELRVLGVLYNLIPEAERGPTQEIPVIVTGDTPRPAPVPQPKDEDKGKPPLPPPVGKSSRPESPVVPPIETTTSTQAKSRSTTEIIQKLRSQLEELAKSPTNIGEHTKRYIEDQKKTINAQIKGLERIDELKIQIGNLEQINSSKFGGYTKQDIALQVERLKQELANLEAKYAPPTESTPTQQTRMPSEIKEAQQREKDLAGMNKAQLDEVGDQMLSHLPKEEQEKIWVQAMNMTESLHSNLTTEDARRMDIINLRTILKEKSLSDAQPPQPAERAREEPIPGFVVTPIEGRWSSIYPAVTIKFNGIDTGFNWGKANDTEYRVLENLDYLLVNPDKFPESLDLPEGTAMILQVGKYGTADRRRYDATDKTRMFQIIGRQNTKVPLGRNVYGIWLYIGIPEHMSVARKPGELYEWDKKEPIAFDDFKKLMNPQAPAKSDLAPEAETLVTTEPPNLTELRKIGSKPFSLADRPFFGISREESSDIYNNWFYS